MPEGEQVIVMTAQDPDSNAVIRYRFIEPITAQDGTGQSVADNFQVKFQKLFTGKWLA